MGSEEGAWAHIPEQWLVIEPRRVALLNNKLIGLCHWMGLRFHDWIDYNGAAFSIESY